MKVERVDPPKSQTTYKVHLTQTEIAHIYRALMEATFDMPGLHVTTIEELRSRIVEAYRCL